MLLDPTLPLDLSPEEIERLRSGGLGSVELVAKAAFERIASVARIRLDHAKAVVEQARSLGGEYALIEQGASLDDMRLSKGRLAQGIEAAREIEQIMEGIRLARRHANMARASRSRRRTRKQLRRLRLVLGPIQHRVFSDGVTPSGRQRLTLCLAPLAEGLQVFIQHKPRKSRLRELRWLARDTRRVVQLVALDAYQEDEQ